MGNQQQVPSGVEVRYTEPGDAKYLKEWLLEPSIQRWFPMDDEVEIDDAVMRWIAFYRYKCSLTILKDGVPCGIATLYLQPYRKLAHQCEFGIIVGQGFRNQGVGTYLMNSIIHLAKEKFKIELLHLQVYAENPAMNLYKRFGFKEFGRQNSWIKEQDRYVGRVFMERFL
ncbi:Acetyltransferase, GNAT family [Candidatus Protochlamydia naegleriophila]|uniref:Acetyltransferase, GNAT family n=1 Tax=Candidatus Protochlamydia naegleriophila TaxID=389348 RepID=A0A0U5J7U4_9BACT|nr:GNAT family N-acetyltransferase [Candidatus Protochlamydia naegleriophila]CUI16153.1 Acetyltransferase, GNAT family [Candidatus Protochlamydia naegleriophila]